jgi:hypothetical protein
MLSSVPAHVAEGAVDTVTQLIIQEDFIAYSRHISFGPYIYIIQVYSGMTEEMM